MQTSQYQHNQMQSCHQISDQFINLLQSKFYVDKTGLITQIAKIKHKVIVMHRPKKFGKSVNARMIYHFYNCIQANQLNNMTFKFSKQNYPSLQIFQHQNYQQMYKKYPCLYFDFKNIKPNSYVQGIRLILKSLVLQNSAPTIITQHEQYLKIIKNIQEFVQLSPMQIQNYPNIRKVDIILQQIAQVVQKIYGNSAYFLIDNYSQPIEYMFMNSISHKHILQLIQFLKLIFNIFQANGSNRKLFLTGILNVLIDYHNITKFSIMKQDLHQYYGFNEKQVRQLIAKYEFEQKNEQKLYQIICSWYSSHVIQIKKQKQIKYWYKKQFLTIFQPFCVQQYLKHCKKQGITKKGQIYLSQMQFNQIFKLLKINDMFNLQQILKLVTIMQKFKVKKQQKDFVSMPLSKQSQIIQKQLWNQEDETCKIYDIKLKRIAIICLLMYGAISGLVNLKQQQIRCFIPNLQILTILQNYFKKQLSQIGIERDFSYIDLQDKQVLKERLQKTMNLWNKTIPSQSLIIFHKMFYAIYGISQDRTHHIFDQQDNKNGNIGECIDNTFFPISKQNPVCYIHDYKFLQNMNVKTVEQASQLILTQIYCKKYINWGVKTNQCNQYDKQPILVDKIVIRSIIFYPTFQLNNKQISVQIVQNQHTISETESIVYFFNTKFITNILRKCNNDFDLINSQILKKTKMNSITQLVCYIQKLDSDQINEYIQNLEVEKKRIRQQSRNQLFQIFQTKNIQKLRIEQISDQILTYSQNELIKISKKENPLNKKQAKQLKQDLDKILNNKISEKSGNPRKIKNNKRN